MLDMGFAVEMGQIMEYMPAARQTLLFSATIPLGIKGLIYHYLSDPEWVLLSEDQIYVKEVEHLYCLTPKLHKEATLYKLLEYENPASSMIFCNTKEETRLVYTFLLGKGLPAAMLSSDLPQRKREKVMAGFRGGEIRHLVTTDVASRGIDIEDLSHVFIFSTPDSPEQYIHRAGRTGRVGKSGRAISLVSAMDLMNFNRLVKRYHVEVKDLAVPSDEEVQARTVERIVTRLAAEGQTPPSRAGSPSTSTGTASWPCSSASSSRLRRRRWKRRTRPPLRRDATGGSAAGAAGVSSGSQGQGPFQPDAHDRARGQLDFLAPGARHRSRAPDQDPDQGALGPPEHAPEDGPEGGADPRLAGGTGAFPPVVLADRDHAGAQVQPLPVEVEAIEVEIEPAGLGGTLCALHVPHDPADAGARGDGHPVPRPHGPKDRSIEAILPASGLGGQGIVQAEDDLGALGEARLPAASAEGTVDVGLQVLDRAPDVLHLLEGDPRPFPPAAFVPPHLHLQEDGVLADLLGPAPEFLRPLVSRLEPPERVVQVLEVVLQPLQVAGARLVAGLGGRGAGGEKHERDRGDCFHASCSKSRAACPWRWPPARCSGFFP